jgi:hypothetical protein
MSRERGARKRKWEWEWENDDGGLDLTSEPCPPGLAREHVEPVYRFHLETERKLREFEAKTQRDLAVLKLGGFFALAMLVVAAIVAWASLALEETQAVEVVLVYATPLFVGVIAVIGKHWIRRLK